MINIDKRNILSHKLNELKREAKRAITGENKNRKDYLEKYIRNIDVIIDKVCSNRLDYYKGSSLGLLKAISVLDDLSSNEDLYNKAYDVEDYYENNY